MCGRYTFHLTTIQQLADKYHIEMDRHIEPRYNIAPGQTVPIVRSSRETLIRELAPVKWGLVPFWAKEPSIGERLINARAETLAEKPAFRAAFRYRRCLIPADGFYEWMKLADKKQPYHVRLTDGGLFAFAGLWERWTSPDGSELDSCVIITTTPNELMSRIHDRMPVILSPDDYEQWLDPKLDRVGFLQGLLSPYPAGKMTMFPVGMEVNNPRFDDPRCLEEVPV